MTSRQAHLAKLFSEENGAMGLYTEAFIDSVLHSSEFMDVVGNELRTPLMPKSAPSAHLKSKIRNGIISNDDYTSLFSPVLKRSWKIHNHAKNGSIGAEMCRVIRSALTEIKENIFEDSSDTHYSQYKLNSNKCPAHRHKKLSDEDFAEAAKEVYSDGGVFIMSPNIIIKEAIDTMQQITMWACMWSKNENDISLQMRAMLKPTITHPKTGNKISPIDMLGHGNNGFIGVGINAEFPTHINYRRIVKQATEQKSAIISPKFSALWLNHDLDIGGCPAMVHSRRTDGIFTKFAQMYIECAQKVIAHSNQLKADSEPALHARQSAALSIE